MEGVGIGLRFAFSTELLERPPAELRWLEVAPENYLRRGGLHAEIFARASERYPVVTHGVTMSLGGHDPLDRGYLADLGAFLHRSGTPWHSDHLCFGSVGGVELHDLLPIPFTRAEARHVAARVREAQDRLGLPMAVENISFYAHPGAAEMDEADFVSEVVREAGCGLLLDVNNVYVNSRNHGFDALAMIRRMPLDRVVQLHVAGHDDDDELLVDTHARPVRDEVYELLEETLVLAGPRPILLERDDNFPPWDELVAEIRRLDAIRVRALTRATVRA